MRRRLALAGVAALLVGASSSGLATVFEAVSGMGAGDIGSYFNDDALVADVEVVDCMLENGSKTQCFQLLASSQPDALSVTGPFCPSTVTDEHGIFIWGGARTRVSTRSMKSSGKW